jgi:hypothetical protein
MLFCLIATETWSWFHAREGTGNEQIWHAMFTKISQAAGIYLNADNAAWLVSSAKRSKRRTFPVFMFFCVIAMRSIW